jgi:HK97 gp10 family phage protein
MAKCEVKLPDELYRALTKLSNKTDEILESTLEAGGKVILRYAKANLNQVAGSLSDRSTGQIQSALGLSPVDVDKYGQHNIKVGFNEPRLEQPKGGKYIRYKKTNAMVANILEYGKSDQPGRPFVRPALVQSKKFAENAIKSKFDEEVNKLVVSRIG